jgi:hypothetical protein
LAARAQPLRAEFYIIPQLAVFVKRKMKKIFLKKFPKMGLTGGLTCGMLKGVDLPHFTALKRNTFTN